MITRDIFENLSPLDHRYYLSNKKVFNRLSDFLSEKASVGYLLKSEASLLKTHVKRLFPHQPQLLTRIDEGVAKVQVSDVYEEEEKTQHNIRALVNVMKRHVPEKVRFLVHLGATSVDILDTANALRMRDVIKKVVLPNLVEVELLLCDIAIDNAHVLQVGRTHGQHAVPITFGFAIAEYVSRLGKSIQTLNTLADGVKGKLAGAVGAYNAARLIASDPEEFEKEYLEQLDLEASEHSTQMVEPEYLLRPLLEINIAFGILANLADDLRHLQRSEIDELREMFTESQVGSSTMPQKRNPWNSEHVKSLWKAFSPRVMTFFMDQISEHQRDLSNSASSRFTAEFIAGFTAAVTRMQKILNTLHVDKKSMNSNISKSGDFVLAEPAYILLALSGETHAHEIIKQATMACEKDGKKLIEALKENPGAWKAIDTKYREVYNQDATVFFTDPSKYTGIAEKKALDLGKKYKQIALNLKEELS